MNIRVLITGCFGMVGGQLIETFSTSKDYELMGVDMVHGDLTRPEVCKIVLDQTRPDVLINCAAFTDVNGCELAENRTKVHLVNAALPGNLARECKDRDLFLVHFSTDYVYDGKKGEPYIEKDKPNPLSQYGAGKLAGDMAIINSGCRYLIIRAAWLFGRHGNNFIEAILKNTRTKSDLKVVNDQKGNPTSTDDLAKAVKKALSREITGLYHFASGGDATWFEYSKYILELADIKNVKVHPVSTKELGMAALRPADSRLDTSLFQQETGFGPQGWKESVKRYMDGKI